MSNCVRLRIWKNLDHTHKTILKGSLLDEEKVNLAVRLVAQFVEREERITLFELLNGTISSDFSKSILI